ncbi:MAG: hypothetical protein JWM11_3256 [Planctomycetaceae bacterium]|nr:hypothetical protein [Planctomycetaceae bacterium]
MMFMILMSLVSISVSSLPFVIPLVYLWQQNRRWIPFNSRRSAHVCRFESLLVLIVITVYGLVWLYDGVPLSLVPNRFGEVNSAIIRGYYGWTVVIGSCLGSISVLLAWRLNTSVTVAFLIIAVLVGSTVLQSSVSEQAHLEWKLKNSNPSEAAGINADNLPPVKLRFELVDNLPGGDLWINGTHLGQTPFETTDRELFAKVKLWDDQEVNKVRNSQDPKDFFETPQGGRIRRWGWCPIHFLARKYETAKLYYRVDLNGVPGFSILMSQSSPRDGDSMATVQVIKLDTVFPAWEVAIEELLDRARLDNYEVDAAWLATFKSYGAFATNR